MIAPTSPTPLAILLALGVATCTHTPPTKADGGHGDAGETVDGSVEFPPPPNGAGWWSDGVFYEVFVRSFADSDGDGVGDLRGLTARLDVLNDGDPNTQTDLGIDGIWLMPVYDSPSYHGYDVVDYRSIEPDYGTLEDFDAFLAAAHARGIRVILDFVLNHSSAQHPSFINARTGQNAEHRSDYSWRADDPGWTQPWGPGHVWHSANGAYFYGIFWSGMPDWNLGNPKVEAELTDAMRFWLARGVDGFRIDAARHLFESEDGVLADRPESHTYVKRLRAALEVEYPEVLLVAEAWTGVDRVAEYYGEADEYHLAFGFDTATALKTSANDGNRADFNQHFARASAAYRDFGFEAPFLANHDMPRVMRALGGADGKMRTAAAGLFAMPGTPFLYYGEELGMVGGPSDADEDKRTPLRWTEDAPGFGFTTGRPWRTATEVTGISLETQRGQAGSLWTLFRDLVALRHRTPALAKGTAEQPQLTGGGRGTTRVLRTLNGERVLFVVNFDAEPSGAFEVAVTGTPRVLMAEGLGDAPTFSGSALTFSGLDPQGFAFIALD